MAANLPSGETYIVPYEGERGEASRTKGILPVQFDRDVLGLSADQNSPDEIRGGKASDTIFGGKGDDFGSGQSGDDLRERSCTSCLKMRLLIRRYLPPAR